MRPVLDPEFLYSACRAEYPFSCLAGSLPRRWPAADTITDMNAAQDAYAAQLKGAGLVRASAPCCTPSPPATCCELGQIRVCDINPASPPRSATRGTGQAVAWCRRRLFLDLLSKPSHETSLYDEHAESGFTRASEMETWPTSLPITRSKSSSRSSLQSVQDGPARFRQLFGATYRQAMPGAEVGTRCISRLPATLGIFQETW